MGNSQPQPQPQPHLNHVLYGEPQNFLLNNGEKTHSVSFPVLDQDQGNKFINRFSITEGFAKRHLLLGSSFTMDNSILCGCGKSRNFHCKFPFFPHSLEQEIQRRANEKTYLSKKELLYLVYQIIDGARNFDRIDEKVGDIRPAQILLDENNRKIKLINHFTAPNQLTGLQKAIELKENTFLAPQQLKALQKANPNPEINVHKADSFSLGLTILAIGNLKKLNGDLYDISAFSFSWTQLSNELETFQNRYGNFLAEIVKGFVQNEPRNRLYIGEVGALLQFYEKHIFQMLDFEPDFTLLQKTYQLNYSGPRSEWFMRWLTVCRELITVRKVVVTKPLQVVVTKQVQVLHSEPVKVQNSRVKFYYTSPGSVKHQNLE